jgi:hypothetical protein
MDKEIESLDIAVYDMFGRQVYISNYKNVTQHFFEEIILDNVSKGIYFVVLKTKDDTLTRKISIH